MIIESLLTGFQILFDADQVLQNLLWCLIGVTVGTLIGALPGLGPTAGIAILLPLTFGMEPITALLLLLGIYQGAMYGGRISSILINVPGDASAVVSAIEGYALTKQGRAGFALTISAIASFVGGLIGFIGLVFLTKTLAEFAIVFSAPDYFSLMIFALIATSGLTESKPLKGILVMLFGLTISFIGTDAIEGAPRMTFGLTQLWDGVDFVVVAIGLFGLTEVFTRIEKGIDVENFTEKIPFRQLFPKTKEVFENLFSMIRGSIIGFLVGVLPGAGATIATFLSYSAEKKISKHPEKFGTGVSQGLSAPEAADNASVGGALIPLFSLGVPGSGTGAILLGALIMLGLQPGPLLLEQSGSIIWPTIAGIFVANILLLILNTMFVPVFTVMIQKVQPYLISLIATLCFVGVYLLNNSLFDVGLMVIFGILGYLLRRFGFPLTPLVLAVVLGPLIETNFRQSLLMSHNSPGIFFTRSISLFFLSISVIILLLPLFRKMMRKFKGDRKDPADLDTRS